MPWRYEVYDGNTHDSTTVEQIVGAMEAKYGQANRVWVMDRGMVSEANLKFLRARAGSCIVGTPKAVLRRFEQYLTDADGHEVQTGVTVKLVPGPEGDETFILARSEDRQEKGGRCTIVSSSGWRPGGANCKRPPNAGDSRTSRLRTNGWGRLKERYWRAASGFTVRIAAIPKPKEKARVSITWMRNPRWSDWATVSEGGYLLRTNLTDVEPATLWKRYIQLTEAEWAFRVTKHELAIRPIWHQKQERVPAHGCSKTLWRHAILAAKLGMWI